MTAGRGMFARAVIGVGCLVAAIVGVLAVASDGGQPAPASDDRWCVHHAAWGDGHQGGRAWTTGECAP